MNAGPDAHRVLQVVRGERPLGTLAELGVELTIDGSHCEVINWKGVAAVARPEDLASGLLRYLEHADELRPWAIMILAGSNFLELDLENHSDGDVLLNAVWDARFGKPIKQDAVVRARALAPDASS